MREAREEMETEVDKERQIAVAETPVYLLPQSRWVLSFVYFGGVGHGL